MAQWDVLMDGWTMDGSWWRKTRVGGGGDEEGGWGADGLGDGKGFWEDRMSGLGVSKRVEWQEKGNCREDESDTSEERTRHQARAWRRAQERCGNWTWVSGRTQLRAGG